jgi:hypothetical protein
MIANHSVNQQLSQQLKNLLLTCAYPNPASSAPPPPQPHLVSLQTPRAGAQPKLLGSHYEVCNHPV